MLRTIPKPVAVLVDEAANLRPPPIPHFKGRAGEGDLVLQPYIRLASYLAVDVLARDTKQRAEAF
jgi:hypothetical protein